MKSVREKRKLEAKTKSKSLTKQKLQPKYEALSIAKYLFSLDPERKYFNDAKMAKTESNLTKTLVGNFRINQILYLLQIFYYVKKHKFLFEGDLYAWDNGFMVYDVYRHFWTLYNGKWFGEQVENIRDKETKDFLNKYFNYFKQYSVKDLEEFCHEDPAWIETWQEEKKEPKVEFSPDTLAFYENFLDNRLQYIEQNQ